MNEIARGAEAIIYQDDEDILKVRPAKSYRHPDLDLRLRKTRTRKEAKVLKQLELLGIPGPTLLRQEDSTLRMSTVKGEKLRESLDTQPELAKTVGEYVGKMHDAHLIHGDLTTSNLMLAPDGTIHIIDFGLSITSTRIEDKAVDLHLFKQALESKHFLVAHQAWEAFLTGYQPEKRAEILERLNVVELRGRNKT